MKISRFSLIVLLVCIAGSVFAQTGTTPSIDSQHTYTVTMENATDNAAQWIITDAAGTALAPQPAMTPDVNTTNDAATLVIIWADSWADAATSYKVQFSETKADASGCISLRSIDVTVQSNAFFLAAGVDGDACHDENGQILATGASAATTVDFAVILDNPTFLLNLTTWEFDLTFGLVGSYSITEVKVGANVIAAPYTGISIAGTEENVTVSVKITGAVETPETVTMTVSNGKAIKGTTVTPDNTNGTNYDQALTINALPATTNIITD
jgi:hypothetical protein